MTIYSEEKPEYIKTNGLKVFSRYFKFEIANPQTNATGDASGFIDALKPQDYADYDSSAGTVEKYTSKARGYIRWLNLSLALSKFGIFFMEVDELTGATALDTPSKITFTVGYEQADEMYAKDAEGNEYRDVEVLKYYAGFALANTYKSFAQVWDPTVDTHGRNPSGAAIGMTEPFLTAEKVFDTVEDAMDGITITEVDGPDGNTQIITG